MFEANWAERSMQNLVGVQPNFVMEMEWLQDLGDAEVEPKTRKAQDWFRPNRRSLEPDFAREK